MKRETVAIIDFGGSKNELIARRVRACNVYSVILPHNVSVDRIKELNPKGIIFAGSPEMVTSPNAPFINEEIYNLNIPILGICYGIQAIAHQLGGKVEKIKDLENGEISLDFWGDSLLFKGIKSPAKFWMNHYEYLTAVPEGFKNIAKTEVCDIAAIENPEKKFYGVQFHPEIMEDENNVQIFKNFLFDICGCAGDWNMSAFIESAVADIRAKVGNKRVLLALSGGVDSSVVAVLINKAIGKQLTCVFVDTGLMRLHEGDQVVEVYKNAFDINLIRADMQDRFLEKLAGVEDPEKKRKIIGEEFIRVFEEEARKLGDIEFLAQGTIYPDIIESGVGAKLVKSHHNVGGLPDDMKFEGIIEPLKELFKEEVRQVGMDLGIPKDMVYRQPFPGPGLGVRVIGAITKEKLDILRHADAIFREEIKNAGLDTSISQYFAVITNIRSVGVKDGARTYDYTIALRAVKTVDFVTATWYKIPLDVLELVSNRIISEVAGVSRIVYDITSKPPATIEWE